MRSTRTALHTVFLNVVLAISVGCSTSDDQNRDAADQDSTVVTDAAGGEGGADATGGQGGSGGMAGAGGQGGAGGAGAVGGQGGEGGAGAAGGEGGAGGMQNACDHPRSTCGIAGTPECQAGAECLAIPNADGAPCQCVGPPNRVASHPCGQGPEPSECCNDDDCGDGVCQRFAFDQQDAYCGGAPPPNTNRCRQDDCMTDDDCGAEQACIPAGAFGFIVNTCVRATCRVDADCNLRAGGECRSFMTRCYRSGFACTYADDPCRRDADCAAGREPMICAPNQERQGTQCVPDVPAP
ncbi:MAG: hypothetical protein ACON3Z_09860 [Bradymonadia bacterium]